MKLKAGDTFRIETRLGFGFLQYIKTNADGVEFLRVLEPINKDGFIDESGVQEEERWNTGFPLKAAINRGIVEKVGNFKIPDTYTDSDYARSEHYIGSEFQGWQIVNKITYKRELKKELNENEIKLSPNGIMNDTLIIERIEQNWRLENWK